MTYAVDRMEGALAVLCDEEEATRTAPLTDLPEGVRAGDILSEENGYFVLDKEATAARRAMVRRLQERLSGGGRFVSVLVPAAGSATRMGGEKQRRLLGGVPVLARTLRRLQECAAVDEIIVAARASDVEAFRAYGSRYGVTKLTAVVVGGATRQQSVSRALSAVDPRATLVAIHDGARPLITPEEIEQIINEAEAAGGATAATPVKDTIKRADGEGFVAETPDRSTLWAVQTPQIFRRDRYEAAMRAAEAAGRDFTDDCQLFEFAGYPVRLVKTGYQNIKITTPEDMAVAAGLCGRGESGVRIGHGYDVHRLVPERPLILGGVTVPYEKGLLGHSDADVLTHAVMDALLGAAALRDIGYWFPDTDEQYKGADSLALLRRVTEILKEHGFVPCNIDATLLAQAPKLSPYIEEMRRNLAAACGLSADRVSVKATTEEKLGFTGAGDGMAAHAVCLIHQEQE